MAGAYVYLLYKQPIYKIQASLLLQDEKRGSGQDAPLKELEVYSPKKVVENELEVLHSSTLMDRVVTNLHLDSQYFRKTKFGKREIYAESPVWILVEEADPSLYKTPLALSFVNAETVRINDKTYPLNQRLKTPYGQFRVLTRKDVSAKNEPITVQVMPKAAAVGMYLDKLKTEPTSKTSTVIHLTLEDAVPEKGEAVLNSLINEYNLAAIADKNKVASNTLKFVENRLRMVSGELSSVERNVENYKSTMGITDLGAQAQSFLQTTQQNDAQLNQVNIQLAVLNDLENFITTQSDKRGSTPATVGINDPVLLGQIDKLSQLELQRDEIRQTSGDENPKLQSLDNQIKNTKHNIDQNIRTMKSMLTSSKEQYVAKNEKLENVIKTVPKQERALMDITRQQTIKNNLYTYLLQKREEMAVTFAAAISDSRTIDAAKSSLGPVKPVGIVIYALFGLVGLLLPTAAIAGKGALNTKVSRRGDVEDVTQVPILGEIMSKRQRDVLIVGPNNRSVIAEQIRTIRTNLYIGKGDMDESQVLLFTSSISGEGKSFMSMNVGASLALVDRPTVILEMDLRKPKLHMSLGMRNAVGISNYLIGEATLDDVLQPIEGFPNYFLISSGPLPPNPSELLNGPYLAKLFEELRARFEYVIVDSPPIGLVTDAQVIAPYADATLYMVRHDITPKTYLKMVDSLYKENRFHNLNVILNAVGDGESYYYSYSYGGYYEDDKSDKKARKALS